MEELLKLLEVVKRDLGANDARIELGGREPEGPSATFAYLNAGWRVVALFDAPEPDLARKAERLRALVSPFGDAGSRAEPPEAHGSAGLGDARHRDLDAELDLLAERSGARAALVIDERSPVVWGSSVARAAGWDLDAMERLRKLAGEIRAVSLDTVAWLTEGAPGPEALARAGVDETVAQRWSHRVSRLAAIAPTWDAGQWSEALAVAVAVGHAREACTGGRAPDRVASHAEDWGVFARGFAQIYLVVLAYDGPYSELHAEGPVVRALPHVEALVLALPPVEPPTRSAKVVALRW